jgi:nicotinamidase-related amidase
MPIIHVRTVLRKGGVDDVRGLKAAWRLTFPLHVGPIPNSDESAMEGSRWTRFVTFVDPDDLIVQTKKRLSIFYPTDLDFLLRNIGARTLVLNGGFTDCCVLNGAFEGSNYGYNIVVVRDLVRGTNEEIEEAALKIISLHLGVVVESGDLLAEWNKKIGISRTAAE